MAFYSEDFIKNLKAKIDCREVFRLLGKGEVRGNSAKCFHAENHKTGDSHPSLAISAQGYKCMSSNCGVSGDCIKLVQELTRVDFNAAITFLAATYGIPLPVWKQEKAPKAVKTLVAVDNGKRERTFKELMTNIGIGFVPEELGRVKENVNYAEQCAEWHEKLHDSPEAFKYLASRGISSGTAIGNFLGFDGQNIVVPYTVNHKIVYYSKRSITGRTFMNSQGEIPVPLGFDNLKNNRIIYFAEGLFDYLTLLEKGYPAIAIPGVETWKMWWNAFLLGNKFMLCFHSDEAGVKATLLFREIMRGLSIPFEEADWSVTKEAVAVKDINDWVQTGGKIESLFHREKTYTIQDVKNALGELIDTSPYEDAIEMLLAVIVANLMEGDPAWVLLVGAPSVGKTELIRSISNAVSTFFINRISPNTLVSGYTKMDTQYSDILTRIVKPTTFCVTDFSSFLSLHPNDVNKVFAQFRDMYDGKVHTEFGNGKIVNWEGKVGMIGGVTPEIERHYQFVAHLGDRFLYYRMQIPKAKRHDMTMKALNCEGREDILRKNIQEVTSKFLDHQVTNIRKSDEVFIPSGIVEKMAYAADLFSIMRTPVARMRDMHKTIEYKPESELGTRSARALKVLLKALAFNAGRRYVGLHDYYVALRLCQGSIQTLRLDFTRSAYELYRQNPKEMIYTARFGARIGKDTQSANYHLKNLLALGIMETDAESSRALKWRLKDEIAELIGKSDFFTVDIPREEKDEYGSDLDDTEGVESTSVLPEPTEPESYGTRDEETD